VRVAALCDALQQRRTAGALGGLICLRDAAIALTCPGKAEAAREATPIARSLGVVGDPQRRSRIACVFVAVVAR